MDGLSAFEQLGPGFYIAFVGGLVFWWYLRSREEERGDEA